MAGRKIDIALDKTGRGSITVDDVRIPGVREISVKSTLGDLSIVALEIVADELRMSIEGDAWLRTDSVAGLLALGWTPPEST